MEVLIQGLEFTNRLQLLVLQNRNFLLGDGHFEESALDLTTKIFQSFTVALSLLNGSTNTANFVDGRTSYDHEGLTGQEILSPVITQTRISTVDHGKSTGYSGECKNYKAKIPGSSTHDSISPGLASQEILNPVITHTGISSVDHGKSTGYSGECKNYKAKIPGSSTHDDLKVGCKRRKTNSHTWVRVTPTPVEDGHAWRKYGQKVINKTEYPRSYYRCTHRNEQGCEATKQVQKTQNKPSMYQTTYMGHHTCKEMTSILDTIPDLMLDEIDPSDSACVINFQTNLIIKQPYTFSSSFSNTSVKHELIQHNEETYQEDYPDLKNIVPIENDLTMSELFLLANLTTFDSISREVFEVLDG